MLEQRLCAVMACADGHAVRRENFADVMRVNTVHRKGDDAAMLLGLFRAQHVDVRHLRHRVHRAAGQRDLLLMHRCKADALDIVNGRMQPTASAALTVPASNLCGARQRRTIAGDRFDHLAAERNGGMAFSSLHVRRERRCPWGRKPCAGEGEEIRVQRLHVHRNVRRVLSRRPPR